MSLQSPESRRMTKSWKRGRSDLGLSQVQLEQEPQRIQRQRRGKEQSALELPDEKLVMLSVPQWLPALRLFLVACIPDAQFCASALLAVRQHVPQARLWTPAAVWLIAAPALRFLLVCCCFLIIILLVNKKYRKRTIVFSGAPLSS